MMFSPMIVSVDWVQLCWPHRLVNYPPVLMLLAHGRTVDIPQQAVI